MKLTDFGKYCGDSLRHWDLSDSYVPLSVEYSNWKLAHYNPDNWNECPACKEMPKVWIFDNGRFAACMCYSNYDRKIGATSIRSYMIENNDSMLGFPDMELCDNWNARCELLYKFINRGDTLKKLIEKI